MLLLARDVGPRGVAGGVRPEIRHFKQMRATSIHIQCVLACLGSGIAGPRRTGYGQTLSLYSQCASGFWGREPATPSCSGYGYKSCP
eukprot:1133401-Pyramimonas_sp.AAC.1